MKNTSLKKISHYLEYAVLRILSTVFGAVPEKYVYGFARLLGSCAYHCIGIRRDVALANLRRALGSEYDDAELKKIAVDSYMNICMTFVEMLLEPKSKDRVLQIIDTSDIHILKRNMEKGRGLIIVSCHFGSWELNGASIAASGIPVTVVAKKQSNPYVDGFINRFRSEWGMGVIPHGAAIKHIVRALRNHKAVGLFSDQDAGKNGVFVSFFGHMASTPRGAAQLALKYKTPVVMTMIVRKGPGCHKSIFEEVEVRADDTIETLTQRYTTMMEKIIRQYPGQYFWMHKRWKTSFQKDISLSEKRFEHTTQIELLYKGE